MEVKLVKNIRGNDISTMIGFDDTTMYATRIINGKVSVIALEHSDSISQLGKFAERIANLEPDVFKELSSIQKRSKEPEDVEEY